MASIKTDQLRAGMALRQDAVHRTGRIILRAGHVLEDEDIRSLRAWGVTEVQIAGDEVVSGKPADEEDTSLATSSVEVMRHAFRHTNLKHPLMSELYRLCQREYVRRHREKRGRR